MDKHDEHAVQEYVAQFYEGTRYDRPWSRAYHAAWMRRMIELVRPHGAILDLGCGNGVLGEFLSKDEYDTTGIDIAENMISYAEKRLRRAVVGDAEALPFPDQSFDIVFARALLHHLPHPDQGMREIVRVLRPGGRLITTDPIKTLISTLPRKFVYKKSSHFSDEHKNFDPRELEGIVERAMRITSIERFGYIAYPLLGFPDICNAYQLVPGKRLFTPALLALDRLIGKIPGINKIAWGETIVAEKS